ncbi:hypothetical protein [Microcoleus sp. herbarium5]|uniref:hypothetical protein n=1 Tax=Microcoleus sp. herbarium5 TaxID=3055434 RepID=UPI002FD533A5
MSKIPCLDTREFHETVGESILCFLGALIMNRKDVKYAKKEEERGTGKEKLIAGNYRK